MLRDIYIRCSLCQEQAGAFVGKPEDFLKLLARNGWAVLEGRSECPTCAGPLRQGLEASLVGARRGRAGLRVVVGGERGATKGAARR